MSGHVSAFEIPSYLLSMGKVMGMLVRELKDKAASEWHAALEGTEREV